MGVRGEQPPQNAEITVNLPTPDSEEPAYFEGEDGRIIKISIQEPE
jgi:hypothetical protein